MLPKPPAESLTKVTDFARELGVDRTTLYRAIRKGVLDAVRVGVNKGTLRISAEARADYLARCAAAAKTTH